MPVSASARFEIERHRTNRRTGESITHGGLGGTRANHLDSGDETIGAALAADSGAGQEDGLAPHNNPADAVQIARFR